MLKRYNQEVVYDKRKEHANSNNLIGIREKKTLLDSVKNLVFLNPLNNY